MWNEIWEKSKILKVTVYHVLAYSVRAPQGTQEAYQLAQVWHIGKINDPQELAHWLYKKTVHKEYIPFGKSVNWGAWTSYMPILCRHTMSVLVLSNTENLPWHLEQISRAKALAIRWQVDYTGPSPLSQNVKYALTCIHPATGLRQAHSSKKATQKTTVQGLRQLCTMYGSHRSINNDVADEFPWKIYASCSSRRSLWLYTYWLLYAYFWQS